MHRKSAYCSTARSLAAGTRVVPDAGVHCVCVCRGRGRGVGKAGRASAKAHLQVPSVAPSRQALRQEIGIMSILTSPGNVPTRGARGGDWPVRRRQRIHVHITIAMSSPARPPRCRATTRPEEKRCTGPALQYNTIPPAPIRRLGEVARVCATRCILFRPASFSPAEPQPPPSPLSNSSRDDRPPVDMPPRPACLFSLRFPLSAPALELYVSGPARPSNRRVGHQDASP